MNFKARTISLASLKKWASEFGDQVILDVLPSPTLAIAAAFTLAVGSSTALAQNDSTKDALPGEGNQTTQEGVPIRVLPDFSAQGLLESVNSKTKAMGHEVPTERLQARRNAPQFKTLHQFPSK